MSQTREPVLTGGCQCGAVRYALYSEPFDPHICHCRMCQKAFGGPFAPLASIRHEDFSWTRGTPALFRSSSVAERGFCAACGTPLSFAYLGGDQLSLAIGSLDSPERVAPQRQYGTESRLAWCAMLPGLPGETTAEGMPQAMQQRLVNHQYEDGEPGGRAAPPDRQA